VRLSQVGNVLSLEFQPLAASATQPQPWTLAIASLPQLYQLPKCLLQILPPE